MMETRGNFNKKQTIQVAAFFLATLLASCASDLEVKMEAGSQSESNRICFAPPIVSQATRTPVARDAAAPRLLGDRFPETWNFSVWAKWTEGSFSSWAAGSAYMTEVYCQHVTAAVFPAKGTWMPDGVPYYWPKNGKLTFIAVAPVWYDNETHSFDKWATVGNDGVETSSAYTFKTDGTQDDLLYSNYSKDRTASTGGTTYEGVDIQFKHALSSIVFKAKKQDTYSGNTITITNIVLKGMNCSGTFCQNATASSESPTWTASTPKLNQDYDNVANSHEVNQTTLTPIPTKDLLVMPQTLDDDVQLTITYTIQTSADDVINQTYTIQLNTLELDASNHLSSFEPGKRYTFNLTFALDKIYFSPEHSPWTEVDVYKEAPTPAPEP